MPITDYVKVNYGYSDVHGEEASLNDLVLQLREYNLRAVLIVSAKLAVIFSDKEFKSQAEQFKLIRSFFTSATIKKIESLLSKRKEEELNDEWAFFNEPPLLSLISLALKVCDEETGKDLSSQEDIEKFGNWMLILAEIWTQKMQVPVGLRHQKYGNNFRLSNYAVEAMRRSFAEQNFLNSRPHILHQFARVSLIAKLCDGNPYHINIDELFTEATGVTIEEYIGFGFIMLINWSPDMGDTDLENAVIKDMGYFKETSVDTEQIEKLLELFGSLPSNFKNENTAIVSSILKNKNYDNNFMIFMRKPIVLSNSKKFMCVSQRYLIQRATNGVYWQMNEYLSKVSDSRFHNLPQAWGFGFEKYINQRLKNGFGNRYIENYKDKDNTELADGLILGKKALFIIETKALHVPYIAQLSASKPNIKSTLKQIFGTKPTKNKHKKHKRKGLQQILHLAKLLLDQDVQIQNYNVPKEIIPIIITEDDLPVDPLNRRYYNSYSNSVNPTFDRSIVKPFILLSVEEAEYLEALANKGTDKAEGLLIEYSHNQEKLNEFGMPTEVGFFKNFLDAKGIALKNTASLGKEFDVITENIRRRYFPKDEWPN